MTFFLLFRSITQFNGIEVKRGSKRSARVGGHWQTRTRTIPHINEKKKKEKIAVIVEKIERERERE